MTCGMNRRQLLATTGVAGLGGCLSISPDTSADKYEWCHSVSANVWALSQGLVLGIEDHRTEDGSVFALDSETGERQWDYGQGDGYEGFRQIHAGEIIYATRETDYEGGGIHAVDYDGTPLWDTSEGWIHDTQQTTDSLYIAEDWYSPQVRILGKTDGQLFWRLGLTSGRGWGTDTSPRLTLTNERLYIDGEELIAVNLEDHRIEWACKNDHNYVRVRAVIDDIACVSISGGIAAVADGEELWSVEGEDISVVASTSDTIFVRTEENGIVRAVDPETGEERWQSNPFAPGDGIRTAHLETAHHEPVLYSFVGGGRDGTTRLFALGLSEGTLRWDRAVDSFTFEINTTDTTQGHEVYITSDENQIERLNPDGQVTWSETVEEATEGSWNELLVDDLVIVGTDTGVYALDPA